MRPVFLIRPLAAAVSLALASIAIGAPAPLPETYRAALAALESGDAERCVGVLEPHRNSAPAEQRGPVLFTLGVALLKLGRHADAERALTDAASLSAMQPKLAEILALVGDARSAQADSAGARKAYAEAGKIGADSPDAPAVRHSAARIAELDAADALEKADPLAAVGHLRKAASLSMDRATEVRARLVEIAGSRKLRGESTAAAIFALGEIDEREGNLPEAIACYQRVFVAWLRFPAWVARAYVRAAECFEKLGRRKDAVAHLHEMMRKSERLRGEPEFRQAQRLLREWAPPAK